MKIRSIALLSLLFYSSLIFAQITPEQMAVNMGRGINAGNVMSAPVEGNWAPAFTADYFNDIKEAGFSTVRIPMDFFGARTSGDTSGYSMNAGTSGSYTGSLSDYEVDTTYLDRVEQVITWALERDLIVILDIHGADLKEEFIDTFDDVIQGVNNPLYTDPTSAKRAADNEKFRAIWTQISNRFKDYTYNLIFEVINEPYFRMNATEMNNLNIDIINIIRSAGSINNDRNIIIVGGGANSYQAPLQIGSSVLALDDNLIATFHYYLPRAFTASALDNQNDFDWGTTADKNEIDTNFGAVQAWSIANSIPVFLGEFGADNTAGKNYNTAYPYTNGANGGPDNASRVEYHRYLAQKGIDLGYSIAAWDAGHKSNKSIYLVEDENGNEKRSWVSDVKNAVLGISCDDTGIIKNSDVECGYNNQWSLAVSGTAIASYSESNITEAFSGSKGIKIDVTTVGATHSNVKLKNQVYTSDLSGKTLTFRTFAKASTSAQNFKFRIIYSDGTNNTSDALILSTEYKHYEYTVTVPENILDIECQIYCGKKVGEYYFDDFFVDTNHAQIEYSGGSWSPTAPSEFTNSSEAILLDGHYLTSSNIELNTLNVQSGAYLTVSSGNTLTVSDLTLNSNSTDYSSLILDGTITGNVNYKRYTSIVGTNDLISPPVDGQQFGVFTADNPNLAADSTDDIIKAFAPFDNSINPAKYVNYKTESILGANDNNQLTSLDSGIGYRVATTDGSTLTFTGTPLKGTQTTNITIGPDPNYGMWNLIGNVYPSYLNVQAFLNNTTNVSVLDENNVGIYGYNAGTNGAGIWTIYNLASTAVNANTVVSPGQGFFVAAQSSGSIEFTEDMRRTIGTDDFILGRNTNTNVALAKLQMAAGSSSYATDIYFIDNATRSLDPGYDAGTFGGNADGLFTHLVENNTGIEFAIQALPYSDFNDVVVPLGIKANQGEQISISIGPDSTVPGNIFVYLEDNVTNDWTLLNTGDYTFTPSVDLNSTGRFFVHFSSTTLSSDDNSINGLQIYTSQSAKTVVVKGQLTKDANITIYDTLGRLILTKSLDTYSHTNTIDISSLSTGLYIVQVKNKIQTKTKKVIIK